MKKIVFLLVFGLTVVTFGQFKDQVSNKPNIHDGIIKSNTSSMFLGFINPNNFQMHHSYSLSYSTFGNNSLALGMYTNSMFYKFADNLNIQADVSLVHSPYSSFGSELTDQINGIYLNRAALNYRPFENVQINIQFDRNPYGYYSPFYRGNSRFLNNGFYDTYYDDPWLFTK